MLLFLLDILSDASSAERVGAGATVLQEAGTMLVRLVGTMDEHEFTMPDHAVQHSLDLWKRFLVLTDDIEVLHTPKRHLIAHMIQTIPLLGNPRMYANWLDESLNKVLKKACHEISQATFEQSLLIRMPDILDYLYN